MKITLKAMDRTGEEVLQNCGAPAEIMQGQLTEGEVLITVCRGDDIGWLTKPRSSAYKQEVDYVIIPYGQRERLEELHRLTAGRNVVFIPQLPVEASDEAEYYSLCTAEAAASVKALIRLLKSSGTGVMAVDETDLERVLTYGENTYRAIFSVSGRSADECTEKVLSHRLVAAKPIMTLYKAFFPSDCDISQLEELRSAFVRSVSGLTLDECTPEVVIVAVYDKAPE